MTSSRSVIGFLAVIALCTVGGCDLLSSPRERAEKLLASGDLPAALTEATHAVADEPDDARAHLLLARIAIAQGDPAMADRALTKAGTLGADPARIAAERARALIGAGDYAAIIEGE